MPCAPPVSKGRVSMRSLPGRRRTVGCRSKKYAKSICVRPRCVPSFPRTMLPIRYCSSPRMPRERFPASRYPSTATQKGFPTGSTDASRTRSRHMRATWFESFGSARDVLQVGEKDEPEVGAGEVLVRIATSGINPSDVKKRAGSFPNLLDLGYVIPNSDGAGVIEAVGNGVDESRIGERVWIYQAQYGRRFGTAAEYVAIDENRAPRLPDNASFEVGACMGIPAMTAHRCVFADGDVTGQTILVTGGAGRVGHYAIQWASQAGATVIASASNDEDKAACMEAGAAHVVSHRDDDFANQVLAATGGALVDRIVDVEFGANLATSIAVLRIGGTIATYSSTQVTEPKLPFLKMMYKDITLHFVIVYAMPEEAKQKAIADINDALSAGNLQHRIAHTLSLAEIAKGNELNEQGTIRGAVVITID